MSEWWFNAVSATEAITHEHVSASNSHEIGGKKTRESQIAVGRMGSV